MLENKKTNEGITVANLVEQYYPMLRNMVIDAMEAGDNRIRVHYSQFIGTSINTQFDPLVLRVMIIIADKIRDDLTYKGYRTDVTNTNSYIRASWWVD